LETIINFIGHFHPILVHLPIGILLFAILMQIISKWKKFDQLTNAIPFAYLLGAMSAVFSCLTGLALANNGDYDADLVFNLGVISYNAKNLVDAEKYYKRAIEIKSDYVNAYLNLAILKLDADKKLFEEIQKLGNSEKDNKRYEVLKKQREAVFTSALPYLEKASELDSTNEEVKSTLLSVYRALEMTEKAKALKAKMKK
jgi:tetratricopeptide (TPR) repeat protein